MKITIGTLAHYQKIFSEAIKYPMKFKTALVMEEFLKKTDEVVKQAMEDFKFNEKKQALVEELNKEIEKRFENVKDDENNKNKSMEELKKEIAKEINDTEASKKDKEINDELQKIEVEIEPITYVLDESLPGIFNISMQNDNSGVVIFRQRSK
jgi:predicted  nucleic acid-binding Zn-ribbon protein